MKRLYRQLFIDIAIAIFVFLASLWVHSEISPANLHRYGGLALFYYGSHLLLSLIFRKYETDRQYNKTTLVNLFTRSWMYSSGIALLLIYTLQLSFYSRLVVLSNIFGLFAMELLYLATLFALRSSVPLPDKIAGIRASKSGPDGLPTSRTSRKGHKRDILNISDELLEDIGPEALQYISNHIDEEPGKTLVIDTTTRFNIASQPLGIFSKIVNLHRLNDVRFVNKFLEAMNNRLPEGGLIAVCAETKNQRKERILNKYPPLLNYVVYTFDFILKRIFPKIPIGKSIYFFLTRGQNRVMSRAEILGRLCSCGFEILNEQKINGNLFVIARKTGSPAFNEHATYGPFIYLNRVGKDGKQIKVYKFRTMHPFSEYLQGYVYTQNNLEEGGKIKDDYRVTSVGRIMRKVWLDELPMLINLFRGELKVVGVRPLSQHYFDLYSPEMQAMRIRSKPGLVPPFYADMPKTFEEIVESERRYLEASQKSPFKTDLRYFFKAFYNIVFRKARSN
jgi:lipopolysaccharide/colanic/teichoic acid biosynthesis glycosyltransferase